MVDIINIICVIGGGLVGSSLLTVFPYFNEKRALEENKEAIEAKPPEQRTPEETYLLEKKQKSFFESYKYRFWFGLLSGVGITLAFLQTGLSDVGKLTAENAFFTGMVASGFFSSVADKIRSTGTTALATKAVAK